MKPLAQNTLIQNRYLVVHLIGKGGMGEVYLAVDQRLGSAVALKRTFFAGDDMLGNAFEREARTLARMRHPVLPKVSDHFGEGDEQYLVMEHISGDDLSKRLEAAGKPFPISWVLFWADQLLDALSYLHTHEPPIIHRDIKPQNLKLTDENHIILLDFGLSKTSTGQTNISQSGSTGSIVGYTPHYAPMEQIRGIGTSPRSDLYSLAATLYQLLTNAVPVDALSRADSMLNGLADPITPPHEINPEVPSVVSEVLLRAMEVSQEKRFANAREMQRVLRKAFNEIQQATTANTVAFSLDQVGAIGTIPPAAPPTSVNAAIGNSNPVAGSVTGVSGQGEQPVESSPPDDFDSTMAYDPPDLNSGGLKQSSVKTEVFTGLGNSLAEPPPENFDAAPTNEQPYNSNPGQQSATSESYAQPSAPGSYPVDATAPFIALDRADVPEFVPPAENHGPGEPEFFESDEQPKPEEAEVPYFRSAESEPEASGAAAPYAVSARTATVPAKKSSGKMIAVIGGLAALVLLAGAVGGGIWAYRTYGPGAIPDPTPTVQPTLEATATPEPPPSPSPTVDANSNQNIGNSNVNNSSTNGSSRNDLIVEPTPELRSPDTDPTPGGGSTRPTPPRTGQTPKPPGTPRVKPTPVRTPIRVLP